MDTPLIAPQELPIRLTWTRDYLRGETPSEEYISGTWNRDGEEVLLRIRFYDCRRKQEYISIYEVRGERGWGEEFLIFAKSVNFAYPPAGVEILRQLQRS